MLRILGAPSRYIQGPGALDALPEALAELAPGRAFAAVDPEVMRRHGARLRGLLPDAALEPFGGEITASEIARLAEAAQRPDVVLGIGGGKTIDAAKGVAQAAGSRLAVVPTAASNDAPTSRLIVIYDQAHRIAEVRRLARNPDLVLVDTQVIAAAPRRLLAAGIGDALSKLFEASACANAGGVNFFGGSPPAAALALAQACYATLRRDALAALAAADRGVPDAALENIVEAAILMSGLAFESGGLSLAHALTRGLTSHARTATALHGEMVAYGTIVQVLAEGRPEAEARGIARFCRDCGLPTTLAALGLADPAEQDLRALAGPTLAAPYLRHLPRALDEDGLAALLRAADRLESA